VGGAKGGVNIPNAEGKGSIMVISKRLTRLGKECWGAEYSSSFRPNVAPVLRSDN